MLLAAAWGRHPFWQPSTLNLSEAAAARDIATVAALIEAGEDPAISRPVRPPLLSDGAAVTATPLEAAVRAGRVEIVALLFARGLKVDGTARAALACEARSRGYRDVDEYLSASATVPECVPHE
jgi:hypothetical protein